MHGSSFISAVLTITDGIGFLPTDIAIEPTLVLGSHLLFIPEPGTGPCWVWASSASCSPRAGAGRPRASPKF
jgi:hypothetical protein